MKKFRSFITLTIALTLATSSIYGQDCNNQVDNCSCAYAESSHTAHWSIYIPIAALVAAAIWFGMADQKHEKHNSSNSQDGLGSMASSKRISHSHHHHHHHHPGSYSYAFRSKCLHGSHSH